MTGAGLGCISGLSEACEADVESTNTVRVVTFFFFQAEDGIRDLIVTGVQTCALPISLLYGIVGASAAGSRSSVTRAAPAWTASPISPARLVTRTIDDRDPGSSGRTDRKSVV